MKIVVLDGYAANPGDISWQEMEELGELTVYERTGPCDIVPRANDAEAVLTNKCRITREVICALPRLRYIGELATGYNNIDVACASEKGVAVTNIPAYSTQSVAQHVFALILEAASRVGEHSRLVKEGEWEHCPDFCFWRHPLTEIAGKRLGVIGAGAIGSRVARIGRAFGMTVTEYSPSRCPRETLDSIIEESDIISLNCPLKKDNAEMINSSVIARMKRGTWLVNTARGGLVDESAVAEALKSGQIGMYMADVVTEEPIRGTNPLLGAPNMMLTPHIAWAPYEARVRLMDTAVNNLKAYLEGRRLNRVDG